jgi:hypothetical protein
MIVSGRRKVRGFRGGRVEICRYFDSNEKLHENPVFTRDIDYVDFLNEFHD